MSLSLKTQARLKKQLGWTDDDFKKDTPSKAEAAQPSTNNIDLSGMTGASRRTRDDAGVRGAYAKREDALTGGGLGDAVRNINTLAVKGIQNNNEADRYNSALVELQKILETGGPVGGMTFREDGTVGQNPSPIKQGSNAVTDALGLVGRNTMAGVDQLNSFLMKSADFFLPDVITPKPVQNVMDWYKTQADRSEQEMLMENYARGGELGAVAGSVYQGLIPSGAQMIFTLMSGGVNNAGTVLNALKNAGVSQGITSAIRSAMKNPSFWTSFAMTAGSDYEDAKANGASETAAITTAFLSSMLNAGIEIGGGVDDLAKNAGRIGWRDVAKSVLGEGLEEVEQGVTTGVVHKGLYDKDREWFSMDNPEAVVNPSRMVSEFAGGSIAGGIFSGGHALINNALNYRPEPAFTPEQRTLLDDIERRLTGNNPAETMSENEENIADRSAQRTAPANVPAAQAISPAAPETPAVAQKSGQSVDSQVLAADMAVMQSLDGVFGENGASFIRQMYSGRDGSVSAADLYQEYLPLYEAGVNGRDMSAVRTRPNGILDETEREVAYQAGVLDAQVSLAQEKQLVGNRIIYDENNAKVNVEQGVKVDRRTLRTLENVAKALGVQVEVAQKLDGNAEGYIRGGKIYVSASVENPVLVVAAHEITHRMQDMAPTEYRAYRDYVMNTLATARGGTVSGLIQQKINSYARSKVNKGKGQRLTAEEAMDEIAASFTRDMMLEIDLFERFAETNRKEANWLVKAIRAFIDKVKNLMPTARNAAAQAEFGADYDVLVQAEKLWSQALKQSEAQAKDAREGKKTFSVASNENERYTGSERHYNEGGAHNGRSKETGRRTSGSIESEGEGNHRRTHPKNDGVRRSVHFSVESRRGNGLSFSFGEEPTCEWARGNLVDAPRESVALYEQNVAAEYGVPSFVVFDAVWEKNVKPDKNGNRPPAFVRDGAIYFRETLDEARKGMYASHELTHVMKQAGYRPYLDFVSRTRSMVNERDPATRVMLRYIAAHRNSSLEVQMKYEETGFFDEVNAAVYGHITAGHGDMFVTGDGDGVFKDFEAYSAELTSIHNAFREENRRRREIDSDVRYSITDSDGKQLTQEQAEYFKDSKVRDENGRLLKVYHGSKNSGFNVFRHSPDVQTGTDYGEAFYFTSDRQKASGYSYDVEKDERVAQYKKDRDALREKFLQTRSEEDKNAFLNYKLDGKNLHDMIDDESYLTEGGEVKEVYLNLTNPLIVDAGGKYYYEVYPESFDQARKNGNDGIVFKNVIDNPRGKARPIDTYVAFRPEQIKNVSNTKPTADKDIRYSIDSSDDLKTAAEQAREIARLRQQVEKWKSKATRVPNALTDERAVKKATRQIINRYGADLEVRDIEAEMRDLYDYMSKGADELRFDDAWRKAEDIAQVIAQNAVAESDDAEMYREMKQHLRGLRIAISDEDKTSIPDFEDFRRRNFGRLKITKDGAPIDELYGELSEMYPAFFDAENETHPADQLQQIADVYDEISENMLQNPFEGYMDGAAADIANDIMWTFFEQNRAAENAADLDKARAKWQKRVEKVKEQERARREKQAEKLQSKFRQQKAGARARQEERELRRKIERHAAKLNQRLLRPTDKQNVPDDLRNAMTAALDAINLSSKNHKMTGRTQAFIKLRREYAAILNGKEDFDLALDPDLFGRGAAQGLFDRVLDMGDTPIAELKMDDLQTIWKVVRSLEHAVSTAGKMLAQKKFARTIEWARAIERDTATFKSKKTTAASHRVLDHETPYTYFNHFGAAGHEIYRMLRNAQDEQQMKLDSIRDTVSNIADEKAVRKLQKDTHTFDVNGEKLTLTTAHVMELYLLNKRGQARDHLMGGGIMQPEIKSAKIESGSQAVLLDPIQLGKILSVLTDEQKQMADKLQKLTTTTLAEWGNDASMKAYGYKKFTGTDYWPIRCAKEEIHTEVENGERNVRSIKNIGMAKAITPGANNALQLRGVFQTFAAHAGDMIDYSTWLCPMEDANRLLNFRFKDEHGVQTGTMKNLIKQYSGDDGYKYWTGLMDDIQNGIGRQADAAIVKDLAKATSYVKASSVGANIRVIVQQPTAIVRAAVVLDPQHLLGGVVKGKTGWRGWQKAVKYAPIAARKAQGGYEIKNMQSMSEVLYNEKTALGKFNDLTTAGAAKADEITWGRIWNACERQIKAQDNSIDVRTSEFNEKVAELFTEVIDQTQVVDGVLQRSRAMRSSDTLVKMATSFMGEPTQSLNILLRAWDGVRRESDGKNRSKAMKTASRAAFAVLVTDIVNAFAQSLVDSTRDDDEEKKYWERVWAAFTGISGDEKSLIDFAKSIGLKGNLVNNLNPINRIYGLKDTMSILQGFTVERMDTSGLADFIKAAADGLAYIGGNGEKTRLYAIRQLLTAGSKLFGIPAANIFRDVISIARSVAIENGDNKALFEMRKMDWRIEDEDNKNKFLGLALKAKQEGDDDVAEEIFDALKDAKIMTELEIRQYEANQFDKNANDLIEAAFEAKKSGDDVALNVLTDMLIGMGYTADKIEDALDKKTLSELRDSWEYAETKSDAYVKIYDEATASAAYSQLTSEQKESFASRVNTYSRAVADDAHIEDYEEDSKWILRCQSAKKEVGMTESQFLVAYHATSGLESLKDKDGETIKNSLGLQKMQAIYNIPGLNEKQRHYMYDACSVGKSIRAYSKAKVNEELAKMRKHAK